MINFVLWLDEVFLSWSFSIIHIAPHFKKPGERWIYFLQEYTEGAAIPGCERHRRKSCYPPFLGMLILVTRTRHNEMSPIILLPFAPTLDCETSERSNICCNPVTFLLRWIWAVGHNCCTVKCWTLAYADQEWFFKTLGKLFVKDNVQKMKIWAHLQVQCGRSLEC